MFGQDKKIAIVTKSWRSGSGWFASALAQSISEKHPSTLLISPRMSPDRLEKIPGLRHRLRPPRELDAGNKIIRKAVSFSRAIFGLIFTAGASARYKNFIFTIPEPLPFTLLLFLVLRLLRRNIIYVVHDPLPHAWSYPEALRRLEVFLLTASYRIPNSLVCLTESAKKSLHDNFAIEAYRIKKIPHGTYIMEHKTTPIKFSMNLLVFGMLRRNKNIKETIEAISQLRNSGLNVTLTIAGEPHREDETYWNNCKELIAMNPEWFNVIPRFIDDDEVLDLINKCDALILPYDRFDSQSGVGVLAATNSRPVIATSVGGIAELFDLGISGVKIERPVSRESIAASIEHFYQRDENYWNDSCEKGRDLVSKTLGWNAIADQYIDISI